MDDVPVGRGREPTVGHDRARTRRLLEAAYLLAVAGVAAIGFLTDSTSAILGAVALSLPMSLPALIGYYLVYGLLALVPGANPSTASGSGSCSTGGSCRESTVGDLAPWFEHTTDVIGIVALVVAALANVALLRLATTRFRATTTV